MKRYYKEENGKRVWFSGILKSDGRQIINPSEEQILGDGWTEYVPPVAPKPTEEELLEQARESKLVALHDYDESKEVNNCIIVYQGEEIGYWKDKHERDALKGTLRDCISNGRIVYRLDIREKGISISLPCETLLDMMATLEMYAVDCYNKTTDHEFAIKALQTREEIEAYDFRTGYPKMPRFELS